MKEERQDKRREDERENEEREMKEKMIFFKKNVSEPSKPVR